MRRFTLLLLLAAAADPHRSLADEELHPSGVARLKLLVATGEAAPPRAIPGVVLAEEAAPEDEAARAAPANDGASASVPEGSGSLGIKLFRVSRVPFNVRGAVQAEERALTREAAQPVPPTDGDWGWSFAPLVYGGDIGYEVRVTRYEEQAGTLEQLALANLRARSYIWQPWFVQLRGGLGLVLSRQQIDADPAAGTESISLQPVGVTGSLGFTLFPVSRFPFDAGVEVTDSRNSGQITSTDYMNTRYGVRQSYSSLGGGTYMSARYERSILESDAFGTDTLNNLEANLSQSTGSHSLQLNAGYISNLREQTGEASTIETVSLSDTYRPNPLLYVETLGYINRVAYELVDNTALAGLGSRTAQITSFATWRPALQSPLYVTGSLRWLDLENQSEGAGSGSGTRTLNATLGAQYQYRAYTRLFTNLSAFDNRSESTHTLGTAQSVGASYTPAPIPLGRLDYAWSASGSVSNATLSGEGSRQAVAGALGQTFTRNFAVSPQAAASANFAQTLASVYDTESDQLTTLNNSLGLSSSRAAGASTTDFASFTLSDSRTFGATENQFQLANLQITRQALLDRVSSWSGNVTIQASRQSTQAIRVPGAPSLSVDLQSQSVAYSVNLAYQHQRAFNVPNLYFYALATANSQQLQSRREGDIDAPPEFIDNSLELRFDYLIGRLLARLSARTAQFGGVRQNQLLFRVTRFFGSL